MSNAVGNFAIMWTIFQFVCVAILRASDFFYSWFVRCHAYPKLCTFQMSSNADRCRMECDISDGCAMCCRLRKQTVVILLEEIWWSDFADNLCCWNYCFFFILVPPLNKLKKHMKMCSEEAYCHVIETWKVASGLLWIEIHCACWRWPLYCLFPRCAVILPSCGMKYHQIAYVVCRNWKKNKTKQEKDVRFDWRVGESQKWLLKYTQIKCSSLRWPFAFVSWTRKSN